MNAEKFWIGWLKVIALVVTIGGILFAFHDQLKFLGFLNSWIDRVFYNGNTPALETQTMRSWLIAVLGAVMASWGLFLYFLVRYPLSRKEAWAWYGIFYSTLLWFVIDTGFSAWYGAWFNVILNTILFLQFLAPLLFLRRFSTSKLLQRTFKT